MTDQTNKTTEPPDWALDMAKLRYDPMEDRAAYNIATSGPTSALPRDPARVSPEPRSSSSVGTPIRPPPGIDLIDKICIAADQRERQQAMAPDATQQMQQMMAAVMQMTTMQGQMLQVLTAIVLRMDGGEPSPKKAAKDKSS